MTGRIKSIDFRISDIPHNIATLQKIQIPSNNSHGAAEPSVALEVMPGVMICYTGSLLVKASSDLPDHT
jgi:hypothetical protein